LNRSPPNSQIVDRKSSTANPRAFTLIELLAVISILVLLMAILLPTLGRARKHGKATVCQANLRQWAMAITMYGLDGGEQYGAMWIFPWCIKSRCASEKLLLCPMASRYQPRADGLTDVTRTIYYGSVSTPWKWGSLIGSYGVPEAQKTLCSRPLDQKRWSAHDVPMIFDSAFPVVIPWTADVAPPPYEGAMSDELSMMPICINRHDGGINMAFSDASVRKVDLKELWTLKWQARFDPAGPWTKAGGVKPEGWPAWMRKFKDY
jgi:prepilin-type N-terminal cleavage/methylation domain-containing protein/prepilin-type processing-associated H-X9-DG protein